VQVVTAGADGTLRAWDVGGGCGLSWMFNAGGPITAVSHTAGGGMIAVGLFEGRWALLEVEGGGGGAYEIASGDGGVGAVTSVALWVSGQGGRGGSMMLAVGGVAGSVAVFEVSLLHAPCTPKNQKPRNVWNLCTRVGLRVLAKKTASRRGQVKSQVKNCVRSYEES
jgi:hypothetical protein